MDVLISNRGMGIWYSVIHGILSTFNSFVFLEEAKSWHITYDPEYGHDYHDSQPSVLYFSFM
jgi:hypothetical protein